jgi:hypothetical protein
MESRISWNTCSSTNQSALGSADLKMVIFVCPEICRVGPCNVKLPVIQIAGPLECRLLHYLTFSNIFQGVYLSTTIGLLSPSAGSIQICSKPILTKFQLSRSPGRGVNTLKKGVRSPWNIF